MVERILSLPIGTVVLLKGSTQKLLIMSQMPITELNGEQGYFDFGATPLPAGLNGPNLVFFNEEDIVEVVFMGYIDEQYRQFVKDYEANLPNLEIKHLRVPTSDSQEKSN